MGLMFSGIGVSRGIAIAPAYVLRRNQPDIINQTLKKNQIPAEVRRFKLALKSARVVLQKLSDDIPKNAPEDVSSFIETHLLMLDDSLLSQRPLEIIKDQRCNAESALQIQRRELEQVFSEMEDPYIATRMDDVNHVIDQIMRELTSHNKDETPEHDWQGCVVIADDLTPADTLIMQNEGVAGFVTETGGPLSHTAILARSLGIPAIVGVHNIRDYVVSGENLILQGESGMVLAQPETYMIAEYKKQLRMLRERQRDLRKLIDTPVVTDDGVPLNLLANIEIEEDLKSLKKVNADGVGLYRTEFLYMNRKDIPSEQEHYKVYSKVVRALKGAPLTIRTADLGADKEVETQASGPLAHNPAMGLRGIRLCLSDTSLIVPQLQAILRASTKGPINIMFPMLTNVYEVSQCLELLETVKARLLKKKIKFDKNIKVGGMIEVPAAAIAADLFARKLDFLSIGTNDLIQYTLAIDRIDDEVNYLYDPLNPAVLQLIKNTIDAGKKADIPVTLCGEMAGDPRLVRVLIGLGLTDFSMPPNSLLEIKRALNNSNVKKLQKLTNALISSSTQQEQQKIMKKINAGL